MSVIVKLAGALDAVEIDQEFDDIVLTVGQIKQGDGCIVIGRDMNGGRVALNVDRIISMEEIEDID